MNGGFIPSGGISGLGSTDNAVLRANGTSGTSAQGSLVTIDDLGNIVATTLALTDAGWRFADPNTGMFASGSDVYVIAGNVRSARFISGLFEVGNGAIGFSSGVPGAVVMDAFISRVGTGTIALRSGTDDQTLVLGAASGTGGGVLALNVIGGSPAPPASGQGLLYVLDAGGGNYQQYSYLPCGGFFGVPGALTIDSGWTANADAGDKTQSVPSSATLATIATAMNLAVSGSGSALQATAAKVKALETALASLLAPNV